MNSIPAPTLVEPERPNPGEGHWVGRAFRAIIRERRLPTALVERLDRAAIRVGWRTRWVTIRQQPPFSNLSVRARRQSSDPFYLNEVFAQRAYEQPGYEIASSDTVVDVGANIGAFTLFASTRAVDGRVIALEPCQDNFSLLQANVRRNGLQNVRCERLGVATRSGTQSLYLHPDGTGSHSLDAQLAESQITEQIQTITLNELFQAQKIDRCDFLKLDCEGAEFGVLRTLELSVAEAIRRIAMEYHTRPDRPKREQADKLVGRLLELGFRIDCYTDVRETNRGLIFAQRGC